MIERLAYPRTVTRLALLCAGLGLGLVIYRYLPLSLIGYVSTLAGPFCLLCAAAVWGMREKADEALSGEHQSAERYVQSRKAAAALRNRFLWRAAWVALCALVAAGPTVSIQMAEAVWEWMVLAAGFAVGESAYTFLLAHAWDEELRAVRERDVVEGKRREESSRLVQALEASRLTKGSSFPGWDEPPKELRPHGTHH